MCLEYLKKTFVRLTTEYIAVLPEVDFEEKARDILYNMFSE
jgi:hypothetical protein